MRLFETIDYQVIKKTGKIEIREYSGFNLATTKTKMNKNLDNGFNKVFDYISGNNESQEKIKMTVPVVSVMEDDYYTTSFVVPKKFNLSQIPVPKDSSVSIEKIDHQFMICITFSGRWDEGNFEKNNQELLDYVKDNNIVITSKKHLLRYNPPFMPSFLRRNEICYVIQFKEA
ncbi:MAG: heme-binding protein [Firmicutes bacterium]|nr:heme-binding protein [Bacillota bacterium]